MSLPMPSLVKMTLLTFTRAAARYLMKGAPQLQELILGGRMITFITTLVLQLECYSALRLIDVWSVALLDLKLTGDYDEEKLEIIKKDRVTVHY